MGVHTSEALTSRNVMFCRNYFIVRIAYLEFRIDLYICGHDVEFEYTLSTISVPVLFGFVSLLLNSVHQ